MKLKPDFEAVAGWLNRKQYDVIMYLLAENEILKEQHDKKGVKVKLSNAQRYKLAKRLIRTGRQKRMRSARRVEVIRGLCIQFAEVPRSSATTKA